MQGFVRLKYNPLQINQFTNAALKKLKYVAIMIHLFVIYTTNGANITILPNFLFHKFKEEGVIIHYEHHMRKQFALFLIGKFPSEGNHFTEHLYLHCD